MIQLVEAEPLAIGTEEPIIEEKPIGEVGGNGNTKPPPLSPASDNKRQQTEKTVDDLKDKASELIFGWFKNDIDLSSTYPQDLAEIQKQLDEELEHVKKALGKDMPSFAYIVPLVPEFLGSIHGIITGKLSAMFNLILIILKMTLRWLLKYKV
jgi:hypothetical protein